MGEDSFQNIRSHHRDVPKHIYLPDVESVGRKWVLILLLYQYLQFMYRRVLLNDDHEGRRGLVDKPTAKLEFVV